VNEKLLFGELPDIQDPKNGFCFQLNEFEIIRSIIYLSKICSAKFYFNPHFSGF